MMGEDGQDGVGKLIRLKGGFPGCDVVGWRVGVTKYFIPPPPCVRGGQGSTLYSSSAW